MVGTFVVVPSLYYSHCLLTHASHLGVTSQNHLYLVFISSSFGKTQWKTGALQISRPYWKSKCKVCLRGHSWSGNMLGIVCIRLSLPAGSLDASLASEPSLFQEIHLLRPLLLRSSLFSSFFFCHCAELWSVIQRNELICSCPALSPINKNFILRQGAQVRLGGGCWALQPDCWGRGGGCAFSSGCRRWSL